METREIVIITKLCPFDRYNKIDGVMMYKVLERNNDHKQYLITIWSNNVSALLHINSFISM
jgi:hypothetical protein